MDNRVDTMTDPNRSVEVIVLERDKEHSIGSSVFRIKMGLEELGVEHGIDVIDNGSTDQSALLASMAGATVTRYKHRVDRSIVMRKAVDIGLERGSDITIILDRMGGNLPEEAVSLVKAALRSEKGFASGYIVPERGEDTLGCLAFDLKHLRELKSTHEDVSEYLLSLSRKERLNKVTFNESMHIVSKKKERMNGKRRPLWVRFRNFRRNHPLKFYGSLGLITLLNAIGSGFYTINYFYINQNLYYPTAFLTVLLVMIAGFLLVAGIMLNALNLIVEKVHMTKRWEKETEFRRVCT
ncbi:MAG: hypothetical protein DRN57_06810 [Thermoplasmata archaeon]|nr:MAG: hypothetical protein DRN57_06810 [Thermoplasmata archaeon]